MGKVEAGSFVLAARRSPKDLIIEVAPYSFHSLLNCQLSHSPVFFFLLKQRFVHSFFQTDSLSLDHESLLDRFNRSFQFHNSSKLSVPHPYIPLNHSRHQLECVPQPSSLALRPSLLLPSLAQAPPSQSNRSETVRSRTRRPHCRQRPLLQLPHRHRQLPPPQLLHQHRQ